MVRSEDDRGLSEAESTWTVILAGPQKRVVTAIIGRPFGHMSTGNEGKSKEGAKVIPEALYKPKEHSRKAPGETWEAGTHYVAYRERMKILHAYVYPRISLKSLLV